MKWITRIFIATFFFSLFFVCFSNPTYSVEPFPPFSVEGNPPEKVYWEDIFALYRYIRPAALKLYENLDRSRKYEPVDICKVGKSGGRADRRDMECSNAGDECLGGEVDLCHVGTGQYVKTVTSNDGTCDVPKDASYGTSGVCNYTQRPKLNLNLKGTDFSAENRSTGSNTEDQFSAGALSYPKLQTTQGLQENIGNDNALTWGKMFLSNNECDIAINQLMVVYRASQTKGVVRETGEWPLGWVDWGFVTPNGKTLIQIQNEIPDPLMGATTAMVEGIDHYYLNATNLKTMPDLSRHKEYICRTVSQAAGQRDQPIWYKDLKQSPIYSPSFRQGYALSSICVFNVCCPDPTCPQGAVTGASAALYHDIGVSREFGAALAEIQMSFSLGYAKDYVQTLMQTNPLIRFAGSASKDAVPSKIKERLEVEMADNDCLKYVPRVFTITQFVGVLNGLQPNTFLGPGKICPNYQLAPNASKESAAAYPQSLLSSLINLLWANRVDDVAEVKRHLVTIPDAMGQSVSELQQDVYNTQDTLIELGKITEYNQSLSNTIDNSLEGLFGGKYLDAGTPKRILPYFSCGDPYFSAQTETSIEDYVSGVRNGCFDDIGNACNGEAFAELLKKSNGVATKTSEKANSYFKSTIESRLTPELMKTYALAEKETGVPCEILAGIHFVEADNNPEGSLVSGRRIGTEEPDAGGRVFKSLEETAIYAGEHLLGKVGGNLSDVPKTITALSRYNGGGNSNCQQGYPYPIPYGGCPRQFEGEDDPYPVNWLDSKHGTMYLLYCADRTACEPQVWERPGAYSVALAVYENMTKNGNSSFADASPVPTPTPGVAGEPLPIFMPKNCGPQSLDTALGCIPYNEQFASSLLGFLAGISGAVALIVMLSAVIQIMTAAGDPKKLTAGKELFTSAIIGLLVVIFSVTLLRIIAGDIIKLPGF